jgi:LacI family transcriptional regulator
MSQRVTLEDIARQSGVSSATVSLALRDKPGITADTRQRVIETARELGYRKLAQPERGSALHHLGIAIKARVDDDPQVNSFYAPIVAGIEAACRKLKINMLFATVPVDRDSHPQELPRMLFASHLDGILLIGAFVDQTITHILQHQGLPTVLVDAYAPGHDYDAVLIDNIRGAYDAVSHLIGLGHRQIGLVGTLPDAYPSIADRRTGYEQALADHGIAGRYFADCHLSIEEGAAATAALLAAQPEITALFCANDLIAVGAIQAARAAARQVPGDLSIIGFDNIELGQHLNPQLTTLHVDKVAMGRLAVTLLAQRAEYPAANAITTVLRPSLVERQSTRRLTAGRARQAGR